MIRKETVIRMEKKKLVVNTAVCDARSVTEEVLNTYDSIVINAASILVSQESKVLFSRYNVEMNVSDMLEISGDVEVMTQNGSYEISEGTIMSKPTMLIVNGSLVISKDAEKALETFISIHVNGSVTYPSSLQNKLPPIKVNGSTTSYPSDAIYLKNTFTLDKVFILRAKDSKYFVKNKVIISDDTLDLSSLITKGTFFITKKAVIAENLLDKAIQLFNDETDIMVIPAGYKYIQSQELNDLVISKYGNKLYVDGDLIISSAGENALSKLTGLKVNGSILIADKLTDKLLSLDVEYNDLKKIKGKILAGKGMLNINKEYLKDLEDGITIIDCGYVQIDSDITAEEIREKLNFIDCGAIGCHPNQKAAIELVSEDVGYINDKVNQVFEDTGEESSNLYDKNTQIINAAVYKM